MNTTTLHLENIWTHGDPGATDADIHVRLSNGRSYVCTFATPERLQRALRQEALSVYPHSEFLGDPYIAVISRIDMGLIRDVVQAMLADNTFGAFFQESVDP